MIKTPLAKRAFPKLICAFVLSVEPCFNRVLFSPKSDKNSNNPTKEIRAEKNPKFSTPSFLAIKATVITLNPMEVIELENK